MEDELVKLWEKPIEKLPTFIDLGRLSKRIDVFTHSSCDGTGMSPLDDGSMTDLTIVKPSIKDSESRAENLSWLIRTVAEKLETKSLGALLPAIVKFEKDTVDQLDYKIFVEELFSVFDKQGPCVKLFKLVNQATLFIAITHMKLQLMKCKTPLPSDAIMTKDVRTADGWRVEIKFSANEITVSHVRRDQCLGAPISPDYWDVLWRFTSTFSSDMSVYKSSTIEVVDMTFGPKVPIPMKNELQRVFYETINQDFTYSEMVLQDDAGRKGCCSVM